MIAMTTSSSTSVNARQVPSGRLVVAEDEIEPPKIRFMDRVKRKLEDRILLLLVSRITNVNYEKGLNRNPVFVLPFPESQSLGCSPSQRTNQISELLTWMAQA